MPNILKKAKPSAERESDQVEIREVVAKIIDEVKARGDEAVRDYSQKFDRWAPKSFILSRDEIDAAVSSLKTSDAEDIRYAQKQIRDFAQRQKESLLDLEEEVQPGVILGHRNIPVEAAGCYVPGGKYPMIASAHMSVLTANVAGVGRILATAPVNQGRPHPAIVAAMHWAGADMILTLGGVHALAAMALGTETIAAVNMLVGPGNAYVAEAKRQLFGKVGIDLIAGPTETLVVADDSVDAQTVAIDLLGQAEHGVNSPAVLITNSETLAKAVVDEIKHRIPLMPTGKTAEIAWRDYGEVIVCRDHKEMLEQANELASEHVQIMTSDDDYFLTNMKNYGALFIGQRTNVAYGDKVIGTNHTLPTGKAGNYTGGLWVGKFIKTCTYQKVLTDEASAKIGSYCSRLCMLEGFAGHAEQANVRVRKFGGREVKPYTADIAGINQ